jgi:hypothetical protein
MILGDKNPPITDSLAAEVDGGRVLGIRGMPNKLKRYSIARLRALEMTGYCKFQRNVKMSNKLENCSNYLAFRHYTRIDEVRLHAAQFCKKHLLCPMCAVRRGAKMLKAYLDKYMQIQCPEFHPYLVTLTVKNGGDLTERMEHLRACMRKMTQQRRNALKGQTSVEFAKSVGGFHSIEVTNRGQGWHPHVHMIWLCKVSPNQALLSKEWELLTGDSYIVDVRPLSDPVEGFLEVCKYALKFGDLSLADNYHAFEVMSEMRLIDSHGILRGVKVPESLLDENLEDEPYIDLFYRFLNGRYRQTSS